MTTSSGRRWRWWQVALVAVLAGAAVGGWLWQRPGALAREAARATTDLAAGAHAGNAVDLAAAMTLNNAGVGHMEQFAYEPAVAAFEKVVQMAPAWLPGHINLGIALLNAGGTSSPEALQQTRDTFQRVLDLDPANRHAHHCLGVLLMYQKDAAEALGHFEEVVRLDPTDASAWFFLGLLADEPARRNQCFETALTHDPYHIGALYQVALLRARENPAKGRALLETYQALKDADWGNPTAVKYGEMGRYGEAIASRGRSAGAPLPRLIAGDVPVRLAPGARWATSADFGADPVGQLRRRVRERFGAVLVPLDFDGDGRQDLFLAGAVVQDGKVRDLLLHATGDGFTDVTAERGLAGAFPTLGVSVGDFDNDGRPDLLLTGAGGVRLFRNAGARFEDVTAKGGLDTLKGVTLSATFVDLDQDSDLDVVLAEYAATVEGALAALDGKADGSGGLVVLLNIGQAPPTPAGSKGPAALECRFRRDDKLPGLNVRGPAVGVVAVDIDGDRDVDLIALIDGTTPAILANDRLLRFRRLATPAVAGRYNGGLILDAEHAGRSDLVLLPDGAAPQLWRSECRAGLADTKDVKLTLAGLRGKPLTQLLALDLDLDGWTDLVGVSTDRRPVVFHNVQGRLMPQADVSVDGEVLGLTALVGDGRAELVAWTPGGLKRLRPDGLTNRGVAVRLSGRRGIEPTGTAVRCNADGVGTFVVAQAGEMWTGAENGTLSAGLGQGRPPLLLGLGRHPRADVIRLRWPDGTWQAELNAATGPVAVRQQNRKTTSCPVLFCHDGSRWRFVTDFLGAGTMGELQPDGSTRSPRPEEAVKIEPGVLGLTDGRYRIEVAEPMDEVTYLDRLRLEVIDHPATTQVYPDERFATGGKPATGRLIAFDRTVEPLRATDHRGTDVTDRLRRWDRATVDGFAKRAWLGYAEEHHVELDFDDRLSGLKSDMPVYLCLAGWTDYAFPESIFAAGQAGVAMLPPMLERRRVDGTWEKVADAGFPAGLPRMMLLDVTGLVGGPRCVLRLRTNLQVYWDQAYLAVGRKDDGARVATLEVEAATLRASGIHREYSPDGRPPTVYARDEFERVPVARLAGKLTRFGDVTELLTAADDRFVLFGPGDVLAVQFDARRLPPLPSGWVRSFVLRTRGYCKDASPFTAAGTTVEPLPFAAMQSYPPAAGERYPDTPLHQDYLRRYNTRPVEEIRTHHRGHRGTQREERRE